MKKHNAADIQMILIWDKTFAHSRMGVPYRYTRMGRPIRVRAIYTHMGQNITTRNMLHTNINVITCGTKV